ncbi:hypothetical protein SASPL_118541 [Salvia splendens]|uniref:Uncharacterized protein n=1 Tax=Salvia splendens TaxID=180675 RepID=A0A8X8Y2J9_SALSN|nr:hypothetical protein SASPL_118541 [Salvia splendens]
MDRSHYPDGDGWINPRLTRVPAGSRGRGPISSASRGRGRISASSWGRGRMLSNSRRRSRQSARDDKWLIHHLFSFICRSHIGEPAESIGASPLTVGLAGGVDSSRTPAGCVIGGEGRASPTGGLDGGEGNAIYEVTDSPVMSDEEFVRRYVITEADKEAWERNKAEGEREVKALFVLVMLCCDFGGDGAVDVVLL